MGFLNHKGTNRFNARVITRNGKITSEEMANMAEAAKLYGDGHVNFTTRLTVEISGVEYDNIDAFQAHLAKAGLVTGGTGNKVRPVVACKGTTCQYGNYDTAALSLAAHKRFFEGYKDVVLPHKFKIAFGGCPNNCVKPDLNDIGIIGANVPQYDENKCRGCKVCQVENACPMKAAKLVDGKMVIDKNICNNCGRCVAKCPFHAADEGKKAWAITIGGRWGKKVAQGQQLTAYAYSEAEVLDMIEKAILLFRSEGKTGERFADTINRIGFERANELMLSNELFERKAEILGLNVVGGGTC
ncbi:MAG: 4Fe-4S dicluster domain-containing protein, partial [Clostridia bacterium]|nr:4Fe-4S dicluster domain-containing protein [Clostridia bacterium]